jgi:hypothetical protein
LNHSIHIYTIFKVFADPYLVKQYTLTQWQDIIRVLRGADLLASFYYLLYRSSLLDSVPQFALQHLQSAKIYADRQAHQVQIESELLDKLLSKVDIKPVFLKGAAYVLRGDVNHQGRIMSDIDILVKKSQLQTVEDTLQTNDWAEKELEDYDQQYYRKWAHELPPYRHVSRGTVLDIHFTLLPPITGKTIAEDDLFSEVKKTEKDVLVLDQKLVVLHCIIHLFFNEDFTKSFRDVLDIHLLINELENNHGIEDLIALSEKLGFTRELYYAFSLRDLIFKTDCIKSYNIFRPNFFTNIFIRHILYRAVMPHHNLIFNRWNNAARIIMYLRGHLLKMPLRVLIPHLCVKTKRLIVTSVMGTHHYEK